MMSSYDRVFPNGAWRVATFCGPNGGNCVEVNRGARDVVGLRDSKAAGAAMIAFESADWGTFLAAAKAGRFDRA